MQFQVLTLLQFLVQGFIIQRLKKLAGHGQRERSPLYKLILRRKNFAIQKVASMGTLSTEALNTDVSVAFVADISENDDNDNDDDDDDELRLCLPSS